MKKTLFLLSSVIILASCDKEYVCNCAAEQGGLPYKKVYLQAKTDNGAERQCRKNEEGTEVCTLE